MRKSKIYCPVNGWGCPYYKDGECGIESPYSECDDFYANWGDDVNENDYTCFDEVRTAFE
jgi:hypothetical protein|nr:MAG TPA: hypothetical protein [Caudoviricetes sp.]